MLGLAKVFLHLPETLTKLVLWQRHRMQRVFVLLAVTARDAVGIVTEALKRTTLPTNADSTDRNESNHCQKKATELNESQPRLKDN